MRRQVVERLLESGQAIDAEFYNFALLFAIAEGCCNTVDIILRAGTDVNKCTRDGTTALMAASERGCGAIVGLLLTAGAEVNAVAYHLTALAVASRNGHRAVVEMLLGAGADVSTFDTALLFAGKNGLLCPRGRPQDVAVRACGSRARASVCVFGDRCGVLACPLLCPIPTGVWWSWVHWCP